MVKRVICSVVSLVGGGISYLFGGWDTALKVLVIMMTLDLITGVIKAIKAKNLSSNIMRDGIIRKFVIFVFIIIGTLLDYLTHVSVARSLVIYFYITNESLSILENAVEMNIPFPEKLKTILNQFNKGEKNHDN